MGALHRGEHMEITTYLEGMASSELSGNMIDICPVGALTSKPYAFNGRPWELTKTETIDVSDAVGSNIRVDSRGREILRILPRLNEGINEEWISDRARFSYDGLASQRLDRPYIRVRGKLQPCEWEEAFDHIAKNLSKVAPREMAAIVGDTADCESMMALKQFMTALGSPNLECRQDGSHHDARYRFSYLFNTTIAGIEDADVALLIGTNPRHEAPMINARLRKRYLMGGYKIALVGEAVDLNYPYEHLGNQAQLLREILDGKHEFAKTLKKAKNPMLIIGQDVLRRRDSQEVLRLAQAICEKYGFVTGTWNGFNVLHTAAARVGGLDLGFVPQKGGKSLAKILFWGARRKN